MSICQRCFEVECECASVRNGMSLRTGRCFLCQWSASRPSVLVFPFTDADGHTLTRRELACQMHTKMIDDIVSAGRPADYNDISKLKVRAT